MPTKLQIENGPGSKMFLLKSGILTQETVPLRFTLQAHGANPHEVTLFLTHMGEDRMYKVNADEDDFTFLAYRMGDHRNNNRDKRFYFVGKYNTRQHQGSVYMMPEYEFFNSPLIGKLLFPAATREFSKSQRLISGTKLVTICVACSSEAHQAKFESVIIQADNGTLGELENADLVVTDSPTDFKLEKMKKTAHLALFGVKMTGNRGEWQTELREEKPELELMIAIDRLSRGEPVNHPGTNTIS